jgi:hypothetical protein
MGKLSPLSVQCRAISSYRSGRGFAELREYILLRSVGIHPISYYVIRPTSASDYSGSSRRYHRYFFEKLAADFLGQSARVV